MADDSTKQPEKMESKDQPPEAAAVSICENCEKLEKECGEYKAGWQRAVADYQNLQKEIAARRIEWAQMSEQQILEEFIPVYDNFKKAFRAMVDTADTKWENWKAGIGHIMRQFGDILKAHNVGEIKTMGEAFDARLHETVGEEENEASKSGTIVREVEGGYTMGGRVIKPAKVIINK